MQQIMGGATQGSAGSKVWIFPEQHSIPEDVLVAAGGDATIAGLLVARGIDTGERTREFLDPSNYTPTSPMELPDVDKAIRRISEAIHKKEHITVYGDYDVDGITGTAVLLTVLKKLGADVDYYIPHRMSEGYGLNLKAVSVLASKRRTRLIITCDCGVSNFAEINFARSLGVDCLVLDHHTMPEVLPPAVGIVHPKLLAPEHPLYDLPGVGVAYKVCEALLAQEDNRQGEADELIDLVTMGMIADLVPLVRENRYLVKIGLAKLVATQRTGLKELLGQVRSQTSTDLVGFGLAPRLNAAGRLSDANKAVELLTTDDPQVASDLAAELQKENTRRQELCEQIFAAADERVRLNKNLANEKCIAIYDAEWHHGVVGIVASRLVEKYNRPVFIGQLDVEEGIVKGSARGVQQLDLYEVLKANEHMLSRWGGHKMAAGFTVEADRADELMKALIATCNKMLAGKPLFGTLELDLVVDAPVVDLDLAGRLEVLAPFGMGNRKPRLCMKGLTCIDSRSLGKEGKHSKIMLAGEGHPDQFECVKWNSQGVAPEPGQAVDIVFTPEVNHFNGKDRLQLVLADWRAAHDGKEITSLEELAALAAPEPAPESQLESQKIPAAAMAAGTVSGAIDQVEIAELAKLAEESSLPLRKNIVSTRMTWRDLRTHGTPRDILTRAVSKLKDSLLVFGESTAGPDFADRTALKPSKHLLIWQLPPTLDVFEELLKATACESVYLVGVRDDDPDEPGAFLKRLFGLVRYAVNQKEGEIHGEKLTALMASSKLSTALGLSVLKKINLVDWYAEEGVVHLDLLGDAMGRSEDCPEFAQLEASLMETRKFRDWCAKASIKDIQLQFVKNGVALNPELEESRFEETGSAGTGNSRRNERNHGTANGKAREEGIGASPEQ